MTQLEPMRETQPVIELRKNHKEAVRVSVRVSSDIRTTIGNIGQERNHKPRSRKGHIEDDLKI
jgi:hypothetical protein